MKPAPETLERNLALLLRRAYGPVAARPAFREELEERLLDRVGRDGGRAAAASGRSARAGSRSSPARPSRGGPRSAGAPRRRLAPLLRHPLFHGAVAAGLLLVVILRWLLGVDLVAPGAPEIVARGEIAVREEPAGPWRAATAHERSAGFALARGFLELATPPTAGARVHLGPLASAALGEESRGSLRVPTAAAASPGAPELVASLERGSLAIARGAAGDPWEIETREVRVWTERGRVELAYAEDAGAPSVRVLVVEGSAWIRGEAGPLALPIGVELFLRDGRIDGLDGVAAPASEWEPADAREPVAAPPEPAAAAEPEEPGAASRPEGSSPSLALTVVDARTGAPVERFRALALVRHGPYGEPAEPVIREVEDDGGRCETVLPEPGRWSVFVLAAGYPLWHGPTAEVAAGETLEVEAALVEAGGSVRGRVVDARTGEPIAGAAVLSENDTPTEALTLDFDVDALPDWIPHARTGADGAFELPGLNLGEHVLRARDPDHAAEWASVRVAAEADGGAEVEIALGPGGTIAGTTFGADGAPTPNHLIVVASTEFQDRRPLPAYAWTLTGAEGAFRLEHLPAGPYIVLELGDVTDPSRARSAMPPSKFLTVASGREHQVEFGRPRDGARVHGRVTDARHRPVEGELVCLMHREFAFGDPEGFMESSVTDADGRYEFEGVPDGPHEVYVGDQHGAEVVYASSLVVEGGASVRRDVHLVTSVVSGRVTSADGDEPLPGSVLTFLRHDASGEPSRFAAKVVCDEEGRYVAPLLDGGRYLVIAYSVRPGYGQARRDDLFLQRGTDYPGLDFELGPGGRAVVRVLDEEGEPVERAYVCFYDESGGENLFSLDPTTDARGFYEAQGIGTGHWTVEVSHDDYEHEPIAFEVFPNQTQELVVHLRPVPEPAEHEGSSRSATEEASQR